MFKTACEPGKKYIAGSGLALTLLFVSIRFLWLGDSSFINDEPRLLQMAVDLNSSGEFYSLGLMGSKGVQYGPVPIWYYRLLLGITHNILHLSVLNTLFITLLTLAGTLKLLREVRTLGPGILYLVFLSPLLWFYSRNMWDNPLNIPVVINGLAWYLAFHRKKDFFSLLLSFFSVAVSLQIHLMAIPFAVSILLHLFVFNRKWILDNTVKFIVSAGLSLGFMFPYLRYLLNSPAAPSPVKPQIDSFLFPLMGGDLFSVHNFSYFLGDRWHDSVSGSGVLSSTIVVITLFTCLSYPLVWLGMWNSFLCLWKKRKSRDPLWHVSFISVSAIIVHIILCLFKGLKTHPHYYNGVWVYSLIFLVTGLNFLKGMRGFKYFSGIYTGSLFLSIVLIISSVHINSGSRSLHYGHTLRDLITAAEIMNQYPDGTFVYPVTFHTKYFPREIQVLRQFYPYRGAYRKAEGLVLRYGDPDDPFDGSLVVEVR